MADTAHLGILLAMIGESEVIEVIDESDDEVDRLVGRIVTREMRMPMLQVAATEIVSVKTGTVVAVAAVEGKRAR